MPVRSAVIAAGRGGGPAIYFTPAQSDPWAAGPLCISSERDEPVCRQEASLSAAVLRDHHGGRLMADTFDPQRAGRLADPARLAALPQAAVVSLLRLTGDETVVDYGAGTGVYTIPIAEALPGGCVIAVEALSTGWSWSMCCTTSTTSPVPWRKSLACARSRHGARTCL
jgi:hypothetical protein